jgi:hypothetical protein
MYDVFARLLIHSPAVSRALLQVFNYTIRHNCVRRLTKVPTGENSKGRGSQREVKRSASHLAFESRAFSASSEWNRLEPSSERTASKTQSQTRRERFFRLFNSNTQKRTATLRASMTSSCSSCLAAMPSRLSSRPTRRGWKPTGGGGTKIYPWERIRREP